jgi:hypothetical protein
MSTNSIKSKKMVKEKNKLLSIAINNSFRDKALGQTKDRFVFIVNY